MYYCLMTKLTSEGMRALKKNPGRIWEVNTEVEQMGAKVIAQYKTLGPYDFVNILEADNARVISRVVIEICSRGTLEPMLMGAITVEDFVKEIEMSNAIKKG
ncbi:MAG TPA: GYD domain-containing protein [Dehalococcoidales bacterium]